LRCRFFSAFSFSFFLGLRDFEKNIRRSLPLPELFHSNALKSLKSLYRQLAPFSPNLPPFGSKIDPGGQIRMLMETLPRKSTRSDANA
jgi:hypothetical protein